MVFGGHFSMNDDSDCKNTRTLSSKNVSQATPTGSLIAPLRPISLLAMKDDNYFFYYLYQKERIETEIDDHY